MISGRYFPTHFFYKKSDETKPNQNSYFSLEEFEEIFRKKSACSDFRYTIAKAINTIYKKSITNSFSTAQRTMVNHYIASYFDYKKELVEKFIHSIEKYSKEEIVFLSASISNLFYYSSIQKIKSLLTENKDDTFFDLDSFYQNLVEKIVTLLPADYCYSNLGLKSDIFQSLQNCVYTPPFHHRRFGRCAISFDNENHSYDIILYNRPWQTENGSSKYIKTNNFYFKYNFFSDIFEIQEHFVSISHNSPIFYLHQKEKYETNLRDEGFKKAYKYRKNNQKKDIFVKPYLGQNIVKYFLENDIDFSQRKELSKSALCCIFSLLQETENKVYDIKPLNILFDSKKNEFHVIDYQNVAWTLFYLPIKIQQHIKYLKSQNSSVIPYLSQIQIRYTETLLVGLYILSEMHFSKLSCKQQHYYFEILKEILNEIKKENSSIFIEENALYQAHEIITG